MQIPLREYWNLLVAYLKPLWKQVSLLGVLLLVGIGLQLLNPQILRNFIDTALAGGKTEGLVWAALLFIGIALVGQGLALLATYLSETIAWRATNTLRNDLSAHALRLDMNFHNLQTPGQLIERIDGDITTLANFFSQFVLRVLSNLILLIGVLILLFVEDWRVGLAISLFAIFTLWALSKVRNVAVGAAKDSRESSAQVFGFLEERLAGTEDIRANGGEAHTMRRYYEIKRDWFFKTRRTELRINRIWMTINTLFALGYILSLVLGAWLHTAHLITLGAVYLIFQYTEMLRAPLDMMTRQLQDLQKAAGGIARIKELRNLQPTIKDGAGAILPDGPLAVEFDNVTFSYNGEDMTLQNLDFCIQPGKVLGLLGRTGSGKTTTTRLIFRLYDINSGHLRVGGSDVREMQLRDLRERVALVTQDVQLFHASVRDNLTFFDRSISDERILEALQELELGEWFKSLPNGLDTEVKSGGAGLSAGEAQLLAFTRVFLKDPGVVILDEASSRLDPATEKLLDRAVGKLLQNRTGIIIAHRLATVQRADDILILNGGQTEEYGPREALALNPNSRFYQLLQTGMEEVLA